MEYKDNKLTVTFSNGDTHQVVIMSKKELNLLNNLERRVRELENNK